MTQRPGGLRLPLVNHLVKQRLGRPVPAVAAKVPARDGDLRTRIRAKRGTKLPQPPPHPRRKPEIGRAERSAEMPCIQLGVQGPETLEPGQVART